MLPTHNVQFPKVRINHGKLPKIFTELGIIKAASHKHLGMSKISERWVFQKLNTHDAQQQHHVAKLLRLWKESEINVDKVNLYGPIYGALAYC